MNSNSRRSETESSARDNGIETDQRELAENILCGDPAAVDTFLHKIRPEVETFLLAQCWSGRSRALARGIVEDLVSECFGGFPADTSTDRRPLLLDYRGGNTLASWLKTAARNRLISLVRSKAERERCFPECQDPVEPNPDLSASSDVELLPFRVLQGDGNPLRAALSESIKALGASCPDGLVLLELHYLHRIRKNTLAKAWNVEPSTIGRRIQRALELIHDRIGDNLARKFGSQPDISDTYTADDFLEAGCVDALESLRSIVA